AARAAGLHRGDGCASRGRGVRDHGIAATAVMNGFATEVSGTRRHAVVVGEGAPVVLVHGFGVSGAYMLPLARALAPSYSALVPDLPGQGKSAQLRGQTSITRLAAALGGWVDAEGLTRPAFVANSMGCQV